MKVIRRLLIDLNYYTTNLCLYVCNRTRYLLNRFHMLQINGEKTSLILKVTQVLTSVVSSYTREVLGLSKVNRSNFANYTSSKVMIILSIGPLCIAINLNTSIGNKETKGRFTYYSLFKKKNLETFKYFLRQKRWSEVYRTC